ncbi:uncharacterized protein Z519_02246 [Cladophialophora bantiana CBS 173.52]|uniref:Uncharacterized protein n=1 Tax=Cladophialophora bantiana (strain ATCC 10958 / CBS 173.52 / CDC B-1940 / NIH 8579) TaxID=1442370 RepID=A0A0D2I0Z5_CLAB1|nr:uncharacterized protein Z519_02246 [Cladophialophora bantiana CBS 173.52]KIW96855.1 hypothetical protein Z519_02246 [Cladophialophora bantiana CBS 173.52]
MLTRLAIPAPKIKINSKGELNRPAPFDDCDGEAARPVEVPEVIGEFAVEVMELLALLVDIDVTEAPEDAGVVAGGMVDWVGIATVLNKGLDVDVITVASGPICCLRQVSVVL